MDTPVDCSIVRSKILESGIKNIGRASIRELVSVTAEIEKASGIKFIRMEMGVPGLQASDTGVKAEIESLESGIANLYPSIEGIQLLKKEVSRFAKLYLDITVPEKCCIPSTGSTSGSFISFLTLSKISSEKKKILFLDPGFPVHKQQLNILGVDYVSLDVYDFRGEKLKDKLDEIFSVGDIAALLYSNPNNPAWICFTERELEITGELCKKYDVIPVEDLAYLNMDFRKDYSRPGVKPFQPTIGKYTDDYIILISSSKIFSYAGQRIGCIVISPHLFGRNYDDLTRYFQTTEFGHAVIYGSAYAVSAGVTHSTQYALAAMLKSANDFTENFTEKLKVYGERARKMKEIFLRNGFSIVYDRDDGEPIADGFYFTVSYPGFSGEELVEELLYYGISAISLSNTGSNRKEGIRACVSLVSDSQLPELERRLRIFNHNHKIN
ncbi:MAG: pyridoxal phosphate-dependent aminotransferase [Ignavibacteria bacterium]|nr:pyridoxal phosphate-dependent aminotransferase [Ignavibacteria bacterium]